MDNVVSVIIHMELALVCSFCANDIKIVIMQWPLKKKTDIYYLIIDMYLYLNQFEYSQAKYSLSYYVKCSIITVWCIETVEECVGLTPVSVFYFCMVAWVLQLFIINLHHARKLKTFFSYIMECVGVCIIQLG